MKFLQSYDYFGNLSLGLCSIGVSVVIQMSSSLHSNVYLSYSLKSLPVLKLLVISQRTLRIGLLHLEQFMF
jgi:hypothetical protein